MKAGPYIRSQIESATERADYYRKCAIEFDQRADNCRKLALDADAEAMRWAVHTNYDPLAAGEHLQEGKDAST